MRQYKLNDKGKIELIVYRRWVEMDGSEYNGKSYIGVTDDIDKRNACFNKKVSHYAGKKMLDAMDVVPRDNWKLEILETIEIDDSNNFQSTAEERETFYIAKFNSYENGLNGNRGGSGNKGVKFDEARRRQNGVNRRGKKQSEKTKRIISERMKGRRQSAETRAKISAGNKGKKRTAAQNKAQSERMRGKEPKVASKAAKEWHKNNPGGWWGNHPISDEIKVKMKEAQQSKGTKVKAILEDGTIQCFPTMLDAANHFGMGAGSISHFLRSGNFSKKAKVKFVKITDMEYQTWKSKNS